MPITLVKLYELNKNPPALLEAMQEWNLIPRVGGYKCPKCSYPMVLHSDQDDGWRWKCNNKISERKQKAVACGGHVRFRKGTFFASSHLTISTYLLSRIYGLKEYNCELLNWNWELEAIRRWLIGVLTVERFVRGGVLFNKLN